MPTNMANKYTMANTNIVVNMHIVMANNHIMANTNIMVLMLSNMANKHIMANTNNIVNMHIVLTKCVCECDVLKHPVILQNQRIWSTIIYFVNTFV